jgi:hypothetical protein
MNIYQKFWFRYLIITAGVLCLIASINFTVDPGEIYLKKILSAKYVNDYTDKLTSAKTAIRAFGNERIVKMSLASKAIGYDCVILGSSHVMSLSVITSPSSLKNMCSTAMNLGVSGGSFEDLLIFSHRILQKRLFEPELPGKIVLIGIDPWLFKWGMDSRYGIFIDDLSMIKEHLQVHDSLFAEPYRLKLFKNLINYDYLKDSFKLIKKTGTYNPYRIVVPQNQLSEYTPVIAVDYNAGLEYAVTLPDGSHLYDLNYLRSNKTSETYIADGDYKLSGRPYDEEVIAIFKKLLTEFKHRGLKIVFVLTPYHYSVFRQSNEKNWRYLREVEKMVNVLAIETEIPVYGSYDPARLGCGMDEFFDFMHPNIYCLARIPFGKRD